MIKFFTKEFYKDKRNIVWAAAFAISLAVALVSLLMLILHMRPDEESLSEFKQNVTSTSELVLGDNPIDFAALQAETPDACAWIKIPDTVIDYPIMQSGPETDEDFYLDHDRNGKSKKAGAIYIQKLNAEDFTDRNTVIYGHNMLNGTMFAQLKKYRNRTFFDTHRDIYIYTPGHILHYKVLSAFVYDDRHILNSFNFVNNNNYQDFLNDCIDPFSLTRQVSDDLTVSTDNKIITLSTCTNNDDERYLVVGVLQKDTRTK